MKAEESSPFGPMLAELANATEIDRYRILGKLLTDLAERAAGKGNGREGAAEEIESLSKRVRSLTEREANFKDKLAATEADLVHHAKQLEAEQTRAHELQLIVEEQRDRIVGLQNKAEELDAQIQARNRELHRAHQDIDVLTLKAERAEAKGSDRSLIDSLEESNRTLTADVEKLRGLMERERTEQKAKIAELEEKLAAAGRDSTPQAGTVSLAELWDRLGSADPPLFDGHGKPVKQSAERLVDTFIELVRFVDDFDQFLRPYLTRYIKGTQLGGPWNVYIGRDGTRETVKQIIAPVGGKPPGVLRGQLHGLTRFVNATLVGGEAAMARINSDLEMFMRQNEECGMAGDRNRKVSDFIKLQGPDLFLQQVNELRGQLIVQAYR